MNIAISGLHKTYAGGVHALRAIDLEIERGMFGLLGPNGAGKTTLMRILAGILRPTTGTVRIGDYDLGRATDRTLVKRNLGYLPQELGLYPDLTAREFLDYVAVLKGVDDKRRRQIEVDDLLNVVSLADASGRKLKTFSGGMKRRVGIAQALLNDPQFLVVDEPTAGLDPEERIHFRNLLSDLAGNRTVLLSTHIVEDIAQTCRELAIMIEGRVVFRGTALDLIAAARDRVWIVSTSGSKPAGDFTIVSTLNLGTSVQYRVIGQSVPPAQGQAAPTEPSLEDGYVWLMRSFRDAAARAVA
jgi:ABC-2 type transport system ATP-binding protein